uniref:Chromo domain-containing protein n=1 Tax=Trichuris muris TaxID=70415 RepID=A0A5S6QES1_TRIMR
MEEAPVEVPKDPPMEQPKEPEPRPPIMAPRSGPGEQLVEFEVEAVMAKRLYRNEDGRNGLEYLVKWKNYSMEEATWEPEVNLIGCEQLIDEFERLSKHCADLHRSSDVLPRRRGRPPKQPPRFERVMSGPRAYGDAPYSSYSAESRSAKVPQEDSDGNYSDEDEYVDEPEDSDLEDLDIVCESYRWGPGSRRRSGSRSRGRGRGNRSRGRFPRLSFRSRYESDDDEFSLKGDVSRRRRGRRAGRGRGRYARSNYYGYMNVGFGSKTIGGKEVTQVVDLVKGEDEKSWAWVVFADGKQEYVPYTTARKSLLPQLLDMYECHLKFRSSEEEKSAVMETAEESLNEQPPELTANPASFIKGEQKPVEQDTTRSTESDKEPAHVTLEEAK